MTKQEFIKRTGYSPKSAEEFWNIHDEYMASLEEKDVWCKAWIELFEEIDNATGYRAWNELSELERENVRSEMNVKIDEINEQEEEE